MSLLHTILTNNFSTFIYHERYDYAEETILIFEEQYSEELEILRPHLMFLFNRGILAFCQKDVATAKRHCQQAIDLSQLFNQKKLTKLLQESYHRWLEGYNDPEFKELTIDPGLLGLFKKY